MQTRLGVDAWQDIDFRMEATEDGRRFAGYAAVFDVQSRDLGGFRETIAPGAFTKTLKESADIRMFVNHDWGRLLASTKAGTLRLAEDDYGLRVDADLPDTQDGRDISILTARGDISSMSFGFQPTKKPDNTDYGVRQVEVRLKEVSPITAWAAYEQTAASVRQLAEVFAEESDLAVAMRALTTEGSLLTDEQYETLTRALAAHRPSVPTTPLLDEWRQRLAAIS